MSVCVPACSKLSCLSVCLSICPSACLSYVEVCWFIRCANFCVCLSVCLFYCLSVCLSVNSSIIGGPCVMEQPLHHSQLCCKAVTSFYTLTAIFSPCHQDGSIKSFYCNSRNFRKQKFLRLWFSRVNFLWLVKLDYDPWPFANRAMVMDGPCLNCLG